MTITANCKINIGLDVLERRADGYHSLSTVMYPIKGLYDILDVELSATPNVEFQGKGLVIDCDADNNLCVKAYNLMRSLYPAIGGVKITLDKRVPFGAGLGGGSSDATAVILALNSLFKLGASEQKLLDIAAAIGSDTAFFVRNTPQLCTGRGEIMQPAEVDLSGKYILLVKPEVHISTKEAYAGVKPQWPTHLLDSLIKLPIEQWQGKIKNDFEPHIFEAYPLLSSIKDKMIEAGALYAAMSGSGSTLFGIFEDLEAAQKAKSEQLESYSPYIFAL